MEVIRRDDNSSFVISHSWRFLYTCGYLCGVSSKKDTKSFVRYSAPEKYCEYGIHTGGGRGGKRHRAKSMSHAQHFEQRQTQKFPALALYTSGLCYDHVNAD